MYFWTVVDHCGKLLMEYTSNLKANFFFHYYSYYLQMLLCSQRPDKPALPEKPSLMNRSVLVDHSKPQIPERPALVAQRPPPSSTAVPQTHPTTTGGQCSCMSKI